MERRQLQGSLAQWQGGKRSEADELQIILERGDSAYTGYNSGNVADKRDLVDTITSNRLLDGKSLEVVLTSPFDVIASRIKIKDGSPRRDIPRTWKHLLPLMLNLVHSKQESQEKIAA